MERKLGQAREAEDHLKDCLQLRDEVIRDYHLHRGSTDFKVDRLFPLVLLGQHAEVAAQADAMRVKFSSKLISYRLACLYALSVAAVEAARQPAALTDEDKALQKSYRNKALDCLEDAVRQGFDLWQELHTDPDLAAVRDDPRFQKLLQLLEK
jgi:hypothetical protein